MSKILLEMKYNQIKVKVEHKKMDNIILQISNLNIYVLEAKESDVSEVSLS